MIIYCVGKTVWENERNEREKEREREREREKEMRERKRERNERKKEREKWEKESWCVNHYWGYDTQTARSPTPQPVTERYDIPLIHLR